MLSRHEETDQHGFTWTNRMNRAMGWAWVVFVVLLSLGVAGDPPVGFGLWLLLTLSLLGSLAMGVALAIGSQVRLDERERVLVLKTFFGRSRVPIDGVDRCVARTDQKGGLINARTHPTFVLADQSEVPFSLVQWSSSATDDATQACARMTTAIQRLRDAPRGHDCQ